VALALKAVAGHWAADPTAVPSSTTVDGPLLGDGETGAVLGIDAATGSLVAYISTNSFWLLNSDDCPQDGQCEGSHRAGLGGVTLAVANGSAPLSPRFTLEQDMANGTVGFVLWDTADENSASRPPLLRGRILMSQGGSAATCRPLALLSSHHTFLSAVSFSTSTNVATGCTGAGAGAGAGAGGATGVGAGAGALLPPPSPSSSP